MIALGVENSLPGEESLHVALPFFESLSPSSWVSTSTTYVQHQIHGGYLLKISLFSIIWNSLESAVRVPEVTLLTYIAHRDLGMGKRCTKNRTHTWADPNPSPSFAEDLSTAEKLVWTQGRLLIYTGTQKTFDGIVAESATR